MTGAAQGIGMAIAERLATEGANVLVVDRATELGTSVAESITRAGGIAHFVEANVETAQGARLMVEAAMARFGAVDVCVNNVGGTIWTKPYWEFSDSEIEREIARSLWPTLWCCHAVLPVMLARKRGAIVNIGSIASRGIYRVPYSAAKGGIHAMTACLAMELGGCGVRINCVAPGGIESDGRKIPRNPNAPSGRELGWRQDVLAQTLRDTPMGRLGKASEVAAAVCFLASDEASYITGQVLFTSGGAHG